MCGRSDLNNENIEMLVNSFEAVNMVTENANHTFAYMQNMHVFFLLHFPNRVEYISIVLQQHNTLVI